MGEIRITRLLLAAAVKANEVPAERHCWASTDGGRSVCMGADGHDGDCVPVSTSRVVITEKWVPPTSAALHVVVMPEVAGGR